VSIEAARTTCSYCPKLCRHECPATIAEKSEVATPTWKQQLALLASKNQVALDKDSARAFWKCTGCHANKNSCRWQVDLWPSMRQARVDAIAKGVAPDEVDKVRDRFAQRGSPYGRDLRADLAALVPATAPAATKPALALFPSCTTIARYPDEVTDVRTVLEATSGPSETYGITLPDPPCCGYPLDAMGLEAEFAAHAKRVAASLEGHARVVPTGAACAWTMSVRYAEVGVKLAPKVVPLVDELAARADAIRILRKGRVTPGGPFAYHDSCYLGRHLGKYEQPRAALAAAAGETPRELDRAREGAYCSGAGGNYPLTHPDASREVALRALEAFRRTGARTLVTGCPSARRNFEKADPTVAVASLASVLAQACRVRS
jgi:Fe-S oxidoreductase